MDELAHIYTSKCELRDKKRGRKWKGRLFSINLGDVIDGFCSECGMSDWPFLVLGAWRRDNALHCAVLMKYTRERSIIFQLDSVQISLTAGGHVYRFHLTTKFLSHIPALFTSARLSISRFDWEWKQCVSTGVGGWGGEGQRQIFRATHRTWIFTAQTCCFHLKRAALRLCRLDQGSLNMTLIKWLENHVWFARTRDDSTHCRKEAWNSSK